MRAVFSWSYQNLTGPAARMFRLLGAAPRPRHHRAGRGQPGRARLAQAGRLLGELAGAHLVAEHAAGPLRLP